ncbi:MAG: bifunctional riboflavin kinase/FAD synthetase [Candidatus Omnitrophota bacterium]|nr:bifunctional riboflavin kinase/FAD synthetase [Candidatus Omnitrophota bacterium]
MRVIYEKLPSKRKKCVATIGAFDGVHLGHKFILKRVKNKALKRGIYSLVITFDIHPRKLLSKKFLTSDKAFLGHIADHRQKKNLIKSLGINCIWFLKTHHSFLKLSGRDFLEYVLRHFDICELIVGEDFRFGYRGEADVSYLDKVSKFYNFNLTVIKKIKKTKVAISSSLIRRMIRDGEFKKVRTFLGRNYYLEGKVIRGVGIGKQLGFPTANIHVFDYILPKRGVYAAYIDTLKKRYLCGVNIGTRPTITTSQKEVVEAHIINFKKNILGKIVRIHFLEKIRGEKEFSSNTRLKNVINDDINYIHKRYRIPKNAL